VSLGNRGRGGDSRGGDGKRRRWQGLRRQG